MANIEEINKLSEKIGNIEKNITEKIDKFEEKQEKWTKEIFDLKLIMARYVEKFELEACNRKFRIEKIIYPIVIVIVTFSLTKISEIIPILIKNIK